MAICRVRRIGFGLAIAVLLAGCAGGGDWRKPGTDQATTDREYRDCAAAATQATAPESRIDQDIEATQGGNWQRSHMRTTQTDIMNAQLSDHSDAMIASCMHAKGFAKRR
jgi:hypothetical protein